MTHTGAMAIIDEYLLKELVIGYFLVLISLNTMAITSAKRDQAVLNSGIKVLLYLLVIFLHLIIIDLVEGMIQYNLFSSFSYGKQTAHAR